jgi:hypothetical protein
MAIGADRNSDLFIDGTLVAGGAGRFQTINPATEEVLGTAANADAAYAQTKRGIDHAVRDGGFIDCGDLIASPVWTEQFEDGERVLWGGLRMLRRAGA